MSAKVGQVVFEEHKQQWLSDGTGLYPRDYSEATAREVGSCPAAWCNCGLASTPSGSAGMISVPQLAS